jgi:hypothetical protein
MDEMLSTEEEPMRYPLRTLGAILVLAGACGLLTSRLAADDETLATTTGPVKLVTLPLEGTQAGKLYFELTPTEAGAASAFKVDINNWAAIEVLTAARATNRKIRVTYKPDFTVTEIEF